LNRQRPLEIAWASLQNADCSSPAGSFETALEDASSGERKCKSERIEPSRDFRVILKSDRPEERRFLPRLEGR
jgi:hypothetical protein